MHYNQWKNYTMDNIKKVILFIIAMLALDSYYYIEYYYYRDDFKLFIFYLILLIIFISIIMLIYFYVKFKYYSNRYYKKIGDFSDLNEINNKLRDLFKTENINFKKESVKRRFLSVDIKRYNLHPEKIEIGIQNISSVIFFYIEPISNENIQLFEKWSKKIDDI